MSVCRDGEELDSQGDASSQPDTISIASRTSQNTLDSDKVGYTHIRTSFRYFFFQRHTENVSDNSLKASTLSSDHSVSTKAITRRRRSSETANYFDAGKPQVVSCEDLWLRACKARAIWQSRRAVCVSKRARPLARSCVCATERIFARCKAVGCGYIWL